ncbi:MAG TPA: PQQ-binding-like beta-propeller repeat protein [Gemmataceae bacterium]|nr:PQQ-binding-like beta-propeller repeat protein [Gemmataceae bacterium]
MTTMIRPSTLVLFFIFVVAWTRVSAADWPGWRGPTGQGICEEKDLPLAWNAKTSENILWKVKLPGQDGMHDQDRNQSSPIVIHGRVIVTVSYWPGKVNPAEFPEHHVACYQAGDGKPLWDTLLPPGPWKLTDLRGGYTAPTPASDGERVYVLFGSSVLAALDLDGKIVWRKEITPYQFDVAIGTSPVLFEDMLILQCDQVSHKSFLVAFDRKTGAQRWLQKRPEAGFSHSTPTLVTIQGKSQLLLAGSDALQGVDPANGNVLWSCPAKGDTVSPVLADGIIYCDSGRGGPALAVEVGKSTPKWKIPNVPEGFSSPVIADGYIYRLHNPGILKCWKLSDGKEMFSERLAGVSTASSPFTTPDGRVYLASSGKSYVIKAGPKLEVLAVNDLNDGSEASPAVTGSRIFLKGRQYLCCVGKK